MQLIRLTFEDHMTMLSLDHGVSTSRESDFPFVLFMYLFVCLFIYLYRLIYFLLFVCWLIRWVFLFICLLD